MPFSRCKLHHRKTPVRPQKLILNCASSVISIRCQYCGGLVAKVPALITTFTSGSVASSLAKPVVSHCPFHHAELAKDTGCGVVVAQKRCWNIVFRKKGS
ncbi:Uncharacterised protein [Leclercia adecarboxylata]|uniref:Uncharacterized protein n=1 Tax=Leclercia adecarboxylata TaxID=83655 RepID=A0A4U9IQ75_9ENTR|nr:Uncharacterised protein [Leclercia adecarboxylata]